VRLIARCLYCSTSTVIRWRMGWPNSAGPPLLFSSVFNEDAVLYILLMGQTKSRGVFRGYCRLASSIMYTEADTGISSFPYHFILQI
jgi:hypothetical protein